MREEVSRRAGVRARLSFLTPCLLLAILLAACAASGGSDDANNAKNGGFYGSVLGGWSHP
jgi:hypothetical protein